MQHIREKHRIEHDVDTVRRAARWIDGVGGPDAVSPSDLARRVCEARDKREGLVTVGYASKTVPLWARGGF